MLPWVQIWNLNSIRVSIFSEDPRIEPHVKPIFGKSIECKDSPKGDKWEVPF
jgi:hypothetical protein